MYIHVHVHVCRYTKHTHTYCTHVHSTQVHVHACTLTHTHMNDQSLRLGKAKQLRLKTTPFFKRKRRAASGGTRTRDVLHTRQTLYQLSHRGSSAGQAESLNVMQRQSRLSPDKQVNSIRISVLWSHVHVHTVHSSQVHTCTGIQCVYTNTHIKIYCTCTCIHTSHLHVHAHSTTSCTPCQYTSWGWDLIQALSILLNFLCPS